LRLAPAARLRRDRVGAAARRWKSFRSSSLAWRIARRRAADKVRPARFSKKQSIDIAERNGEDLRRVLRSAERLSERAISTGVRVNTPGSRSSAALRCVTACDHFRWRPARRVATEARRCVDLDRCRDAAVAILPSDVPWASNENRATLSVSSQVGKSRATAMRHLRTAGWGHLKICSTSRRLRGSAATTAVLAVAPDRSRRAGAAGNARV
jgi:hypothetical protein